MLKRPKITIVGAGNVGATAAHLCAYKQLGDVVLVDVKENLPQGKALDLAESAPIDGFDSLLIGSNGYEASRDSDVVVITAGIPRKPGMSRDDLITTNAGIVGSVTDEVVKYSPNSILVLVSNPLDVMVYLAHRKSGFPANRVMGMAGVLDTARYRTFIAEALGVSVKDVVALVLGGHGDLMVPLPRHTMVGGIPLTDLMPADKIEAIVQRTRDGGAEIVKLMGTSAYYAPGAAVAEMVDAIVHDRKRILPVAAYCESEYGANGLYVGVPAILGANGVERIFELKLDANETAAMQKSCAAVRELVGVLKLDG